MDNLPSSAGLLAAARQAVRERAWDTARELCERLLATPDLRYEGLDLSAAVALSLGRPAEALALAEAAIGEDGAAPRGYLRRGGARLALGEPADAEADFRKAAALDPGSAVALQSLAFAQLEGGRAEAAAASFEAALALHGEADASAASSGWGLAQAWLRLGRPAAARRALESALESDPGHELSLRSLIGLSCAAFDWPAAERHLREALRPGRPAEKDAGLRAALADVLRQQGRLEEALEALLAAPTPLSGPLRSALASLAADRRLVTPGLAAGTRERLAEELAPAFEDRALDPQELMAATVALAKLDPRCERFWAAVEKGERAADDGGRVVALLLRALERALVTDFELEARLLEVRRALLLAGSTAALAPWRLAAVCALAAQAALGYYLHPLDEAEQAGAARWRGRLADLLAGEGEPEPEQDRHPRDASGEPAGEDRLRGLGVGQGEPRPEPDRLPGADAGAAPGFVLAINALAWPLEPLLAALGGSAERVTGLGPFPPPVERLLARQLEEPAVERRLAAELRGKPWREDASSALVRRQYEQHPYPRWSGVRLEPEPRPPAAVLHRLFPWLELPSFLSEPGPILVAGCGTGQQAIAAAGQFRAAKVLAIDLSAESLAYAKRMAGLYAFAHLELRRADLLALDPRDGLFDVVLCTGVLHHLEDPEAGWKHLSALVRAGGVLKIALYSRVARRGLAGARAAAALALDPRAPGEDGEAIDEQVRAARRFLAAGPHAAGLGRFVDFYSLVGCRDLLFHVRERAYSLPEIAAMAERLGLRFLGFELPREIAGELYSRLYPLDRERRDLGHWAALEAAWPDTFLDMYQMWFQVPEKPE